ncbi:hypothetical protein H0Z60_03710 [Ectothiorhodospiraceae bacterium WFHF3C12]|nr:hypothetical protein [Ectothiorhodospiraceae bacterium WFHF3C12]
MKMTRKTGAWRHRGVLTGTTLLFSLALAGCGGGSGSDENTDNTDNTGDTETTYTGTVEAPSGQIAQLREPGMLERLGGFVMPTSVAAITGLQPVPDVEVELVRLNSDGSVAEVVTTVTANSSGEFTLNSELAPNSNHIFRVSASGGAQMRVPMARSEADINPGTEMVVRAMETAISSGATLDDWTPEELDSLVVQAVESDVDLSSCSDIDSCVTSASDQVPTVEEDTQTLAENDGVTGPEGEFRFAAVELAHSHPFWEVGHYFTELTLSFSGSELAGNTTSAYDDWWRENTTGLEFDTSADESLTLGYSPGADGRLIFSDSTLSGGYSADGQVAAMLIRRADDYDGSDSMEHVRGFVLGVKVPSSAPSLSGDYNIVTFSENTGAVAADSQEGQRDYETGAVTASVSGGNLNLGANSGESSDIVLPAAGSGVTGTVNHESVSDPSETIAYSLGSDGGLSVAGLDGQVTSSGDFFYLMGRSELSAPPESLVDMVLATRAGTGMDVSSLQGTYRFYGVEGQLSENEDGLMSMVLTADFDGSGSLDLSGVEYESDVDMIDELQDEVSTSSFSESGISYTVSASGEVSLDGGGAVGAVTPDGEVMVLISAGSEDDDGDGTDDGWWHGVLVGFREPAN